MLARCGGLAVLLFILLAGCSIPGSAVVDGPGIVGTYTVNGVDAVDIEYSGTVVIEPIDGTDDQYAIQWIITGAIHEGVGTLSGDRFDATWTAITSPRGEGSGSARYTLTDDGRLVGTRTIDGVTGEGTEEIFPEA